MNKFKMFLLASMVILFTACGGGSSGSTGGDIPVSNPPVSNPPVNNPPVSDSVEKPSLALMVAKDTDKIEIAWIPSSDGVTPMDQVVYKIHLSTDVNFTTAPATLKKTVTGVKQAEITGLLTDTLYYGKVVAVYSASTSGASNSLQSKTYKYAAKENSLNVVEYADALGLGKHTTSDGSTYTYSAGGTPPAIDSILFSEDITGGMTIRTVVSTSVSGAVVTVETSDASLTDALDVGSIYSSFQLFDVASQASALSPRSSKIITASSTTSKDGSQYSSIVWDNKLLSAEQTTYAYSEPGLVVIPQKSSSLIKLSQKGSVTESFTATVTAEFEPKLITAAEWGSGLFGDLDSAHVAAVGTLSLTALAQYNFAAEGEVDKEFRLFKRPWFAWYNAGPVLVYQEIILTLDVKASASASAKIEAMAKAELIETVEVGARYDGSNWIPYITHGEEDSLTASLDIAGEANAEIRVIPKIEVKFYKVVSADLTVEPFAKSSLTVEEITNNEDFLAAYPPERWIHLTSFDNLLGMQANTGVTLGALGYTWDALPTTCVLGTEGCMYDFKPYMLFSIPKFELSQTGTTDDEDAEVELELKVTDGTHNEFDQSSVKWEAFPNDATVTPGSCTKSGSITTCTATVKPDTEDKYAVFASGYGIIGEMGRQFTEIEVVRPNCVYIDHGAAQEYRYEKICTTQYEKTIYSGGTFYRPLISRNQWFSRLEKIKCNVPMIDGECTDEDLHFGLYKDYTLQNGEFYYSHSLVFLDPLNMFSFADYYGCGSEFHREGGEWSLQLIEFKDTLESTVIGTFWDLESCVAVLEEVYIPDPNLTFPGSCYEWWGHYDDQGNWVECQ